MRGGDLANGDLDGPEESHAEAQRAESRKDRVGGIGGVYNGQVIREMRI